MAEGEEEAEAVEVGDGVAPHEALLADGARPRGLEAIFQERDLRKVGAGRRAAAGPRPTWYIWLTS